MQVQITAGPAAIAIGNGRVSPPITLAANASKTFLLSPEQFEEILPRLAALGAGKVTYTVLESGVHTFRKALAASGATGTLVDDAILTPAQMGAKLRIIDMKVFVSTLQAATTATLRDRAAGAGVALSSALATSALGRVSEAGNASFVTSAPDGVNVGLFLRRDRAVVGEVVVTAVLE